LKPGILVGDNRVCRRPSGGNFLTSPRVCLQTLEREQRRFPFVFLAARVPHGEHLGPRDEGKDTIETNLVVDPRARKGSLVPGPAKEAHDPLTMKVIGREHLHTERLKAFREAFYKVHGLGFRGLVGAG